MLSRYAHFLVLIASSAILLVLALVDNLTLYVHPRYVVFTVALASAALILSIISVASTQKSDTVASRSSLFVYFALAACIVLYPSALSKSIAQDRVQSSRISIERTTTSTFDSFTVDFTHFDLQDWTLLLATSSNTELVGKQARVVGFIFGDESGNVSVGRFQLSCCAVDASPLSIPLLQNDISKDLVLGQWYEITGVFAAPNSEYRLEALEARGIEEPEQPYVF